MTTQSVFPSLRYRDAAAAIPWLVSTFGLAERAVYADADGVVRRAELGWTDNIIMIGTSERGTGAGWLYLSVANPDAHFARAVAAGARVVRELADTEHGSREYTARDLEGNLWSFGTYLPV
ncbi:glyoxalase [Allokutzneria sp. A3M-2-11 16]|uniref:VOC family protein n=1 Tax=Allokutzneria sp. A3M-2-11 16 TaxID=2962043 RepID=UPI0020B749A7|nr:VOC family protein [Allokutzneria sp. A3M-2-11 16]MCP3801497.1 glyoxalase [Allokutzneria sp. A3M-2-11 16]